MARAADRIRQHYVVEKELAARLRAAPVEQRRRLYSELYDELFRRVPDHPMLTRKHDARERAHEVGLELRRLRRFLSPEATLLELGPGDCALSLELARRVRKVYAIDVSPTLTARSDLPANLELVLSDGSSIPLPAGSVDCAYSNQLIEHLHPDDALAQLRGIHAALKPGGVYLCVTPNRLNGPHDISRGFDATASGFHLREYRLGELVELFRDAGFREFRSLLGARGRDLLVPVGPQRLLERALLGLPEGTRRRLANWLPARILLSVKLLARK